MEQDIWLIWLIHCPCELKCLMRKESTTEPRIQSGHQALVSYFTRKNMENNGAKCLIEHTLAHTESICCFWRNMETIF